MVWDRTRAEFRSPAGIVVQFLIAIETAGKGSEAPVGSNRRINSTCETCRLIVLRLSQPIEMKIARRIRNLRRMHKDFAYVVELIAARNPDSSFAYFLHPSLRPTFRELVQTANASDRD